MKKSVAATISMTLTVMGAAALSLTGVSASPAPQASLPYIVVLTDDAAAGATARDHARAYGAEVSYVYRNALKGYAARMTPAAAARVAAEPEVAWVQADGVVQATGKPTPATGQTLPTGINRANADASPAAAINRDGGDVNVDVAVIDTGIDLDHPDLNVNLAGATNCSTGNSADDGNGHGTHVAGTIGAKDNTIGVVGMAPGARLWPVRVLDNRGSGTWSGVICGIDYVAANADKIEVANMSLGGSGTDDENCGNTNADAMHAAICRAVRPDDYVGDDGVTFVVAAGNDSDDAANHVPAAYNEVITVSALADFDGLPDGKWTGSTCRADVDDTFADFSNYGADVDLIAPGVCINSTWKGGGYKTISGTSMASPHVAGGAALYLAEFPGANPETVMAALQGSGTFNWNDSDGRDGIKEKLLDVSTY